MNDSGELDARGCNMDIYTMRCVCGKVCMVVCLKEWKE